MREVSKKTEIKGIITKACCCGNCNKSKLNWDTSAENECLFWGIKVMRTERCDKYCSVETNKKYLDKINMIKKAYNTRPRIKIQKARQS